MAGPASFRGDVVAKQLPPGFHPNAPNPLLNPNIPLAGKALLQAAQALATAQTAPVISALQQQIGQNNAQTRGAVGQVGGLYNQLGQQAQNAAGRTGQVATGLNSQLQGIGNEENAQLQGIGDNAVSMLARYTPGDVSQASPALQALTGEIARQKGLAAQNEGAFRSFGATQGANYQGLANSLGGTFALGGQEALRNIASAGRLANLKPEADLANERATYGADLTTALGRLRQQEITNSISRAGLGLKQESLQNAVQNNRANQQIKIRGQNITRGIDQQRIDATVRGQNLAHIDRQSAIAVRQAAVNLRSGSGGAKPLTTYQNNKTLGVLGKLQNAITVMQQQGIKDRNQKVLVAHPNPTQIRQALSGVDPLGGPLTEAAFELLGYGALSPATARALHAAGIRGGTFRGAPIKVGGQYSKSTNSTARQTNQGVNNAVNSVLSGL